MSSESKIFDIIVVGAGHAGIEASLAAARMGVSTLMLTLNLDHIGQMSCNPAIGGIGKGHLVKEIDALGGEMGRAIDETGIQFRLLNTKKGPAVRASRAQADKALYRQRMKRVLENCSGLTVRQGSVEALIVEDAEVKEDVFRRADRTLPAEAILASNTSSIPITSLAGVTQRPDRVIGMHFFNPVPVLELVEVVRGRETSDETADGIIELARELGKTPAVANDFPGFVSNRILMPYINEAVYALQDGVADVDAIDTIAKLGFAHPLGPLALADLIGLDTCVAIMKVLQNGLGDDKYAPAPLLETYVEQGKLGRKSGEGFYIY